MVHKYWVQFVLMVRDPQSPGAPPTEFLEVISLQLKEPLSNFDRVNSMAALITNICAQVRKISVGDSNTLAVKVLTWKKLEEESLVYVPPGN